MEADLIFHNVGQGLFYSGQIRCDDGSNFNFVYDCGATDKHWKDRSLTLDTCIDRYTKYLNNKNVDMLVISHFHHDHINGIEKLLEKNNVQDVIIPFYTFEERFVTYFSDEVEDITDEQLRFLLNPYQFFLDRNVERIIVIRHEENRDGMNDSTINLDDLNSNIPDESEYAELQTFKGKITLIADDKPLKKACWSFAFFADDKFKGKFDQKKAKKEITNLKNATTKQSRQNAIQGIKSSYNISSAQMNETSMIMVHKFDSHLNHIYPFLHHSHPKYYPSYDCHHVLRRASNHIHILTGDFDFKKTSSWNSVAKHFGTFLNVDASIKQIAHHGSIDNWDNDILTHTPKNNLCVIPYGTKNTYGHPAIGVIKDIISANDCLYEVTENQSLMLFYKS